MYINRSSPEEQAMDQSIDPAFIHSPWALGMSMMFLVSAYD
jgi:hypothetical protein